jgi:hypothetical protein
MILSSTPATKRLFVFPPFPSRLNFFHSFNKNIEHFCSLAATCSSKRFLDVRCVKEKKWHLYKTGRQSLFVTPFRLALSVQQSFKCQANCKYKHVATSHSARQIVLLRFVNLFFLYFSSVLCIQYGISVILLWFCTCFGLCVVLNYIFSRPKSTWQKRNTDLNSRG